MTLEERVTNLENFIGDMNRISSVYANSLQEICDKYLSLLYIEKPSSDTSKLMVDGWLGDVDIAKLPKNTIINVRASHTFAKPSEYSASKIVFKRDNKSVELPLKKYDLVHKGNLIFLEPGDYIDGIVYDIYINSQNIAIISSSDTGNVALQMCTQLETSLNEVKNTVQEFNNTINTSAIKATSGSFESLTVSKALSFVNSVALPTGSTCSTPASANQIANKEYVDATIKSEVNKFYNEHHIFGSGDPAQSLESAPDRSIFYRYR